MMSARLKECTLANSELVSGYFDPNESGSLFFFFSSRRRHTRCSRDWSSDVCSSDLTALHRARCSTPQGQSCRRSGQPRDDSQLLFASVEGGRALGSHPKVGARNGIYLSRGPHANRL